MADTPLWVRACLWRVKDRSSAIGYLWTFAVVALGSVAVGVIRAKPIALAVSAFCAFAFATTWLAIKWRDRHGWTID
jgi:hypothetical protein